ncbi:MAG: flagellar basal body P-ring protein FlgI, partial [Pirellula sp.]|nr:flagellar basal body P-ring protein FlgI [Pirellula sp.]
MFPPLPANKPPRPILARVVLAGFVGLTSLSGCQSWFKKSKEEDSSFVKDTKRIQEIMSDPDRPRLIGEVAGMAGIEIKIYESFGLVAGLPGTGGKVKPSEQRNIMLQEMRTKGVDTPEQILDDPTTALVKVRVFGNPGFTAGKVLDVGIETSTECDATDLTGGKLFEARLREMAFVGGRLRSGSDQASASGELVHLPSSYTRKNSDPRTAVIVGGGTLLKNHPLSVLMTSEFKHVLVVKEIEKALNKRFYYQDSYKQKFMAEGKNSALIAITSVPKYRLDPAHFSNVILATGFNETDDERKERVQGCKRLLADRTTAKRAAAELEALGT